MESTLYVTRPTELSDERQRYSHSFRPNGRIVEFPEVGDQVIDVLEVHEKAGRYEVWSKRRNEAIRLSSAWSWGDQYEEGAEYELAQECLGVWRGRGTLLNLEYGPLFPLVYPIAPRRRSCGIGDTAGAGHP